jgi:8-oxo-dGTP pyrophosphatase MutT (NUDIX family)
MIMFLNILTIFISYSWTGGHADGCANLLLVAQMELEEETGIKEYHYTDHFYNAPELVRY